MAEEESNPGSPHSLKNRLRFSLCFSCCFPHHQRVRPRIVRSASLHNKPRSTDFPFPQLKEKCCNFINRIGGRHRRRHSADFHYDALSYALNFEDYATADERHVDELKSFSARLPASPPPKVSPTSAAIAIASA
ncbi:hypothetical protein AAZX31_17G102200 [Glycine max]|uniref:Uncharacterized protein n=2 Tax=Glycine subgen. Soja TaxID=1462606 RepID=I1MTZ4_SOYBN|nr:uncharacterized protein LOC102667476 [Glycine max]XP_028209861.1 uncharacterized protein LOC114392830 [Glycine soja]KAG4932835.1 hypothetical protein JHK87_046837 [Glycine soja]KAH1117821.1 hypothetical protein GYH30_046880 [Glycine max]KAH1201819.1 hypothetical protein GmHk_17G048418 [Glycine max]KRH03561.1 hypothetical protein GLYMA_17G105200v4 [Glycine max]RZB56254.1 hypothetical protein D0Y65_045452 [Glycine soja]|eukprot:XP_006600712.1 uncharacterized protein LOC102667476 [Glycine max]